MIRSRHLIEVSAIPVIPFLFNAPLIRFITLALTLLLLCGSRIRSSFSLSRARNSKSARIRCVCVLPIRR